MWTRIKQCLLLAGVLGITLMLSGCFFSEQTLIIGPDGKADVKVEFWFDKIQAGDQGSIAIQELHYLFLELQNYEAMEVEKDIGYTTYIGHSFQAKDIDINKNQYIDFVKKDDGSYSLVIRIPKAIEEKKEKNDKVLTIKVTMPAEIDMANTMNYEGRTAEWELRTNDFMRDITLKTFTKVPSQEEIEKEMREETSFEREGNIYIKNAEGKVQALTNTGKDFQPCLSPDGEIVVFVRSIDENISTELDIICNEIWSINVETKQERLLICGKKDDDLTNNLSNLRSPQSSPDGKRIYFMSSAWVTSAAIHVMNSDGTEERFLTGGNSLEVLQETDDGEYNGYLIVEKHKYFLGGGSYDWHWLVTPDGEEVGPISNIGLFKELIGHRETVKSISKEEIQKKTEEKTLLFSTPENTIKTLVETIAFGDKNFASQYFSNRQYNSEIVTRNFYEVLKEQNLISQVKKLTYSTTELDGETCLVWIFPPGNDKKSLSWKVIQEEGRWYALSYCYYRLSSGINWNLEDLEEWKNKGYKLQNLKLTDELDLKETCLISIFTPFSDNPSWPGPESGTFGPFDKYSQSLNNALVIYRLKGKDAEKLSQRKLPSGPCKVDLKLMDINNNGSKEIVVKSTWCGASACSYEIKIFDFRNNHLIQVKTPNTSYELSYELVDINKDGVYELLSAGFSYLWDCHANTVYSSLVWSLEKDQYKRDPQSFSTFYQEKIKEIKTHITEELTKSEEEFHPGDYFKDVISLYVNYAYIDQNEKGYQEIKKWISESKFVSTWDKYYKKRLGLCEDIIEEVKLEMNEWKIEEMEDVSSEIPKSTLLPAEERPEEES